MAQSINTNMPSLNAQRNLNTSQTSLATSMQRLSSGLRVNSAKDDAAGLAIAERMNTQIRGMNVAVRNANDGISFAQTAEGSLSKIGDNLQRMRELAVQSRNATNSEGDRSNLQKEFTQLQEEIDRTIKNSKFNGGSLFSSASTTLTFQVGAGTEDSDRITVSSAALGGGTAASAGSVIATFDGSLSQTEVQNLMATLTTTNTGNSTAAGISIGGTSAVVGTDIDSAIKVIDEALTQVNDKRAQFGAVQNRFEAVISNLQVSVENESAARGRIMDADFAAETANLSRSQILQQAGTAMLTQANQLPQAVLQLLQG
ncbi:MAG: flagellin FliC [Aquabacterium sp.]|jgi:flagellin|uniref:flagellin N-terminal helical domain-containing protein n=1 Tax=Aquabacterium sp. TaxID=1872578 RepID=UPI001B505CE9|nr:flagellin [Aquabacterium sp.]MBP7131341.1 flagellin FliC [Aquabacterium sp.]MBP8190289.1 flagellin FliC [Aquabacterium sp.]MBP9063919.1 flagellin FliC [Aquabacterium sp.]MDQ5925645.1 flagellin [Pseudomonadota bacterium]